MSGSSPEMSVVLVTPDRYETIRKTVEHLRAQTVKDRLELVIVAPSAEQLALNDSEVNDFFQFRIVAVGEIRSIARAHAAGIRQASAPVVVLSEDHSFPEAGWAEALIERHRQPWAVVGPVVRNANPDSLMSWADFLLGYGTWLEPAPAGEINYLPGHNSSYKRAILLDYNRELEAMLETEFVLHRDLRAKGHRLYLEPAACWARICRDSRTAVVPAPAASLYQWRTVDPARAPVAHSLRDPSARPPVPSVAARAPGISGRADRGHRRANARLCFGCRAGKPEVVLFRVPS